ncbi:hypothetical protein [Spirilliplanes yamanashiensis]|uniref:Uncharacterized protein n=1 Tax=Spirilliplanes yamanashiensis TaxID=42233 RepID=A0A8J4DFU2_9ACTN|nr:hypothetical protein [Spirilliplanes yamanashiensis]MDP9814107.1 hypothetical protein [Spirilliplanes yamanashiensis]GIJ00912.1 hypothetical protein Sya03_02640 [Spirilliplanes yamanashiensis]
METALSARRLGGQILVSAAGALGMIAGLMVLLDQLGSPERVRESLVAGAVATAGGAALIFLPRLGLRVRPVGVIATAVVALAGTAASLVQVKETTGGMYAYLVGRGYPFLPLRRGDTGETPGEAQRAALAKPWNFHWTPFLADLAFWAFAGVLLVIVVALVRKAVGRRP